eukprot:1222841-Prymnesium_polylepis.3
MQSVTRKAMRRTSLCHPAACTHHTSHAGHRARGSGGSVVMPHEAAAGRPRARRTHARPISLALLLLGRWSWLSALPLSTHHGHTSR